LHVDVVAEARIWSVTASYSHPRSSHKFKVVREQPVVSKFQHALLIFFFAFGLFPQS